MRNTIRLVFACLLFSLSATAQWRLTPYKYEYHGVKADSLNVLPKVLTNPSLLEEGAIRWNPTMHIPQGYNGTSWIDFATSSNSPIDTVASISALQAYAGNSNIILVTDSLRGGLFLRRTSGVADNGTVFTAVSGYWWRQYNETMGVLNVCWFGAKGDGVTDDAPAIRDALAAVRSGGAIYFPTRCAPPISTTYYKVGSSIVVTKTRIKIFSDAESKAYSTCIYAPSGTFPVFTVNIDEVSFWGLAIRGNGAYTIIDAASGAGRWGEGATISGIKVNGDASANGDVKIEHCSILYCDTAIALNARNADIFDNILTQCKQGVVIGNGSGQIRGFKIQNNWFHSLGDTSVGKAVFKCVNPRAFQIWIQNNLIDGQSNAMMADITADSAVQITGNNVTLGRGGLLSLTGVNGATVSSNYYLGGSWQTRGDGILLTNTKNVSVTGNTIIQPANNGISLINGDNAVINANAFRDFSYSKKANPGNFSGIVLDAASEGNSVYNNQLAVSSTSAVYGKAIDAASYTTNHFGLNDQYLGANFNSLKGIEFASAIKVPTILFQAYDSVRKWDISYRQSDSSLLFSKTGSTNPLRLSDGVAYADNLFDNAAGKSRLGVGNGGGFIGTDSNPGGADGGFFGFYPTGTSANVLNITGASSSPLRSLRIAADSLRLGNTTVGSSSVATINGNLVWHAGNDGTGSGLDADLLDGLNSTSFAQAATTMTVAAGNGVSVAGGTQDISTNRTWTVTNTGILNQTASEEAKSFWAQFGNMRTLTLKGNINPLVAFNDGTNSVVNIQLAGGRLDFNNPNSVTSFTGTANVAFNSTSATSKIDINGTNGYSQFRMRTTYTPTSSADANGNTGDLSWDANYIYIKTAAGWKRSALTTF